MQSYEATHALGPNLCGDDVGIPVAPETGGTVMPGIVPCSAGPVSHLQ